MQSPSQAGTPGSEPIAVSYQGVSYAYPRPVQRNGGASKSAIENISLQVHVGERLGILGPNGGGKSTLLKLTLGLLGGHSGRISIFGLEPDHARRQRLIGYVPQRIEAELAFPLSVGQVVEMGACGGTSPWSGMAAADSKMVDRALSLVGALDLANRPIGKLSGGQVQRVMIARALAARPKLLLLDEPTVGIDVAGQQRFSTLLRSLHDELGLTIIVVSHDIRTIAAGCDRVACLSRTLHSHTAPSGLTPQVLAEVFSHDVAAIFGDVHVDAHLAQECPDEGHAHTHPHHHDCGHDHGSTEPGR